MRAQYPKLMMLLAIVALVLSACLGGAKQAAPPPSDVAFTEAAKTIVAELTRNAPLPSATALEAMPPPTLEQLPPTSTPLPTNTPIPTEPAPPTLTPLPTNTPLPTAIPTQTIPPAPVYQEVFSDDFQSGYSGWATIGDEGIKFGFTQGGYTIESLSNYSLKASARMKNMQFADVRVEVIGSRMKGPLNGYYGVVCRFADLSNYYFMAVGSDGWFGIGKLKFAFPYLLMEGKNTAAVYTGNAPNRIVGDCVGDTLTMTVNDVLVGIVQDTDFSAGGVGVMVGTRAIDRYKVLFDDFKVYVPE